MSYADERFKIACRDILENGTSTEGQEVRPKWPDGEKAYTIKKFGVIDEYDLRKEFPALTLRKVAIKSCTEEVLWITQKKSNNIKDLKPHVWDEWADENGSIGKAYGYQVRRRFLFKKVTTRSDFIREHDRCLHFFKDGRPLPSSLVTFNNKSQKYEVYLDQMDSVLYQLKYEPFSRRIMLDYNNFADLSKMRLQPCAFNIIFNVEIDKNGNKVLNAILNQRSQDMLAANGWNVCQYAVLLMMIAQSVDMIPGKLIHTIADCHIYDRHIPMIKELLEREEHPAPKVTLNPDVVNFYDFTSDDVIITDYEFGPQIKDIPIAI